MVNTNMAVYRAGIASILVFGSEVWLITHIGDVNSTSFTWDVHNTSLGQHGQTKSPTI